MPAFCNIVVNFILSGKGGRILVSLGADEVAFFASWIAGLAVAKCRSNLISGLATKSNETRRFRGRAGARAGGRVMARTLSMAV
jgi:hypothetical protein